MLFNKKTKVNLSAVLMIVVISMVGHGNVKADFVFGTPINLGPNVNSPATDWSPSLSSDGLQLYLESDRPGGFGREDLWVSTRATPEDDWGDPVNLGPTVNTGAGDWGPSISADGLELYFSSNRSGGSGGEDLWVSKRATRDGPWGTPVNLGSTVNSSSDELYPGISSDGLELYFNCDRDWGLYVTRRASEAEPWGPPVNVPGYMIWPGISSDGRMLLFGAEQAGGYGNNDVWMRTRATTEDDWGPPANLGPTVNGPSWDCEPCLSYDGRTLYFTSDRGGGFGGCDTWQVSIDPVVDLNNDGIVDSADMVIMVDNWGTDNSLCDIGPMPWGDGVVDVQDLIALAEHLFEGLGDTVIERRVSASTDDAEEALNPGFNTWNYSSDLEIVHDRIDNGGEQLVGMTFRDIAIMPGEVISNAYIEFVCDERINGTADAYLLIWGHLTPNSEGFKPPFVISNRPKTEAKVPWEPDPWDAGGQKIQTVNIAPVLQELIDQPGWSAGNAVEIIIGVDPDRPAFTGVRCAESYDGSPASAPLLHIEVAVP